MKQTREWGNSTGKPAELGYAAVPGVVIAGAQVSLETFFFFTSPNLWLFYTGGVCVELVGTAAGVVALKWPFWRLSAPVGLSVTPLLWALVSS